VFLDRDGTLIDDAGYLSRVDRISVKSGVFEGIRTLLNSLYVPVVVTNQSGVARGLIEREELKQIHRELHEKFYDQEAPILAWYYCPHLPPDQLRPDESPFDSSLLTNCCCRKPQDGLWREVVSDCSEGVRLSSSWSVGDRTRDVRPGIEMGTEGVMIGNPSPEEHPDEIWTVDTFEKAVSRILGSDNGVDG
jgi:D-glycero-D-manno-heptose 1,7-bisphosphate phosphatase